MSDSPVPVNATDNTAKRNIIAFIAVSCAWVALDQLTKSLLAMYPEGTIVTDSILGIFDIRLIHNSGAAWGLMNQSAVGLGIFAAVVCVLLIACVIIRRNSALVIEPIALALIFAGGVGNAIDRLANGYVIDFINFDFISFPVFNVADIGVTCGFVLLIAVIVIEKYRVPKNGDR